MFSEKKVTAVVVTYNRFVLVQKTVSSLRNQTRKLDAIIVVDNHCTDGTAEWLDKQEDLIVIHQENIGGSGGFWRGIKEAYNLGYDWIWCMDDDVFPDSNCLHKMLSYSDETIGILCPHRMMNGQTFIAETKVVNLWNPFRNTYYYPLKKEDVTKNEIVDIQGMAFEGPLIRRDVVKKIGLPNKDLFILYDDTDYSYRTILAGFRVVVVRDAIMDKHCFTTKISASEMKIKNKWKLAYHIRNNSYFCHEYGKNIFVREFGAMPFLVKMYFVVIYNFFSGHKYSLKDIVLFTSMINRGKKNMLGKM